MESKNILITGASGLIGSRLTELLEGEGHQVSHLTTSGKSRNKMFKWNVKGGYIESGALVGIDTVIHLAGAGIADKRWTAKRKEVIERSRVDATRLIAQAITKEGTSIKTFVSASAVGFYGLHQGDRLFVEEDDAGTDFLGTITSRWEHEVDALGKVGIRTVKFRIGVVLSERGGALKPMARPVRYGLGAYLGSGDQMISWIHLEDLCRMFLQACHNDSLKGAYNAVSPNPITNRVLTNAIAKALHKPIWLPPVPAFIMKLMLGEMAELVLLGCNVSAKRILETGFQFKYARLEEALKQIVGATKEG